MNMLTAQEEQKFMARGRICYGAEYNNVFGIGGRHVIAWRD